MLDTKFRSIKFTPKEKRDFGRTLQRRVNEYFKSNDISRKGDYRAWIKVITMPLLFLLPFGFIMTNWFSEHLLTFYGLWLLMGVGLAGCGLSVMHDACHGSLSKHKAVNNFVGASILNFAAGSSINWKIQHNILHHSFTNIEGHDEDISPAGVMRFSPNQPVKSFFKFQAYYAWFFYGLMTFLWATTKDFDQLNRFNKMGLVKAQGKSYIKEMAMLIARKLVYYSILILLPIFVLDVAWYHVLIGWFSMHFLAGLTLASIFQAAHIVSSSSFPLANESNVVEEDVMIHQLMTTANFAPTKGLFTWYVGGLNYQIEHHLFPNVSHVHLPQLSKIVKKTAEEFGLPYHSSPTFRGALIGHVKFLHQLGR